MCKNKPDGELNSGAKKEGEIAQTTNDTTGVVDLLVQNGSINALGIPNLTTFLTELRDKGLIGLANYNNGTMYYVPEDAIGEFQSESSIGGISINVGEGVESGVESFAGALGSRATQNIENVFVLQDGKYVETNTNDQTFDLLNEHPECVKISGLAEGRLGAKRILYTTGSTGEMIALNFLGDDGLPLDLTGVVDEGGGFFSAF